MERVPKHIQRKVYRIGELVRQAVSLEVEVAEWLEARGVKDGLDFMLASALEVADAFNETELLDAIRDEVP